jgi:ferrous iron transport protein A
MSDRNPSADAARPISDPTLDQIPRGETVRVRNVVGDDAIARRLGELGVRKGVEIEVLQRAPLGDPTLFELCGYQLCLRRRESARIHVEPASGVTSTSGSPGALARNP